MERLGKSEEERVGSGATREDEYGASQRGDNSGSLEK